MRRHGGRQSKNCDDWPTHDIEPGKEFLKSIVSESVYVFFPYPLLPASLFQLPITASNKPSSRSSDCSGYLHVRHGRTFSSPTCFLFVCFLTKIVGTKRNNDNFGNFGTSVQNWREKLSLEYFINLFFNTTLTL